MLTTGCLLHKGPLQTHPLKPPLPAEGAYHTPQAKKGFQQTKAPCIQAVPHTAHRSDSGALPANIYIKELVQDARLAIVQQVIQVIQFPNIQTFSMSLAKAVNNLIVCTHCMVAQRLQFSIGATRAPPAATEQARLWKIFFNLDFYTKCKLTPNTWAPWHTTHASS